MTRGWGEAAVTSVLVAAWIAGRLLGVDDRLGLSIAALAGLAAWWHARAISGRHRKADPSSTPSLVRGIAVGGFIGLTLAAAAISTSWWLGGSGDGSWALRVGLQLGWWTDRLPFLPGKLLALLLWIVMLGALVVPDELVARGALYRQSQSLGAARASLLQALVAIIAAPGYLWLRPAPTGVWAFHFLVAAVLALVATWLRRRWSSLGPAIALQAIFLATLVLHAFAWIPRLYR